ncbi:MAG: stage sporulation protein [Bacillota bacterium]|nr:stage sporulation protein [Bacillota bacterium]
MCHAGGSHELDFPGASARDKDRHASCDNNAAISIGSSVEGNGAPDARSTGTSGGSHARRGPGGRRGRPSGLKVRSVILLAVLACAIAYCLTFGSLPDRITILEGSTKDLWVRVPLDVRFRLTGAELVRMDTVSSGAAGVSGRRGAGVRLVPLAQGDTSLEVRLLDMIPVKRLLVSVVPEVKVIPGGHAIGVLLSARGVVVVGHYPVVGTDGRRRYPAREAGIEVGDVIVSINGQGVDNKSEVERAIDLAGRSGKLVEIKILRDSRAFTVRVRPVEVEAEDTFGLSRQGGQVQYKIGIWVRENAAGVGTLSFYEPESRVYCALGHVITDAATNREVDVARGRIVQAHILGIHHGSRGQPGEKVGSFSGEQDVIGTIERNTKFGIFGTLSKVPRNPYFSEAIPIAMAEEVTPGYADLYTVVEDSRVERFRVEIQRVARQATPQVKGLVIRVVDPRLLSLTGGIVQGMSGSPIVKDNKLVGVLTHVFVSDQTRGYGVLAEWLAREAGLFMQESRSEAAVAGPGPSSQRVPAPERIPVPRAA